MMEVTMYVEGETISVPISIEEEDEDIVLKYGDEGYYIAALRLDEETRKVYLEVYHSIPEDIFLKENTRIVVKNL